MNLMLNPCTSILTYERSRRNNISEYFSWSIILQTTLFCIKDLICSAFWQTLLIVHKYFKHQTLPLWDKRWQQKFGACLCILVLSRDLCWMRSSNITIFYSLAHVNANVRKIHIYGILWSYWIWTLSFYLKKFL